MDSADCKYAESVGVLVGVTGEIEVLRVSGGDLNGEDTCKE